MMSAPLPTATGDRQTGAHSRSRHAALALFVACVAQFMVALGGLTLLVYGIIGTTGRGWS
jgi:hypothetical protein